MEKKIGTSTAPIHLRGGRAPRIESDALTIKKAKALAMLRADESYETIIAATGLSSGTVSKLKKGEHFVSEAMIMALMGEEEKKLTLVQHRLVDSILEAPEEELDKMPVSQRMIAAAIAIDKRELLAGRPTQRLAFGDDDSHLSAEIEKLKKIIADASVVEVDFEVEEATLAGSEKPPE